LIVSDLYRSSKNKTSRIVNTKYILNLFSFLFEILEFKIKVKNM